MIRLLERLLSKQNPNAAHTLLNRMVVSFCICFGFTVLYGFYGLVATVAFYLIGVELLGVQPQWMFFPIILGLLYGGWKSYLSLRDYWANYGHPDK